MLPLKILVVSVLGWNGNLDGVVLDFSATWCGPCQQISPTVSKLERQGYPIHKVDVDANRDLVRRFNIQTIPAFVLVIDGVEQERLLGGQVTEDQLKRLCSRIPKPPKSKPENKSESKPAGPKAPGSASSTASGAENDRKTEPDFAPPKTVPEAAEKPAPTKPWFNLPFVSDKKEKDELPAVDPREGKVSRGKYYDNPPARPPVQGNPVAASVRVRVRDSRGEDVGSGTIIDSRIGSTTVLTCGHIFRNWDKSCVIEVDYFGDGKMQTYAGKRVFHNLEDDVGLISIVADPLPACRVAPVGMIVHKGSPVVSVGCSGGDKPSEQRLKITALNRYLGADNIECSGVPEQGRSGGGLFTKDGQLIGVCTAAAPHNKEGLYAGLKTVQKLLDRCMLAHLYRPIGAAQEPWQLTTDFVEEDEVDTTDDEQEFAEDDVPEPHRIARSSKKAGADELERVSATTSVGDEAAIRDALEQAGEAEIICIIRPIHQPRAASRVVILNRASRRFVAYLSDELDTQEGIHETTLSSKAATPRPVVAAPPAMKPGAKLQTAQRPPSKPSKRPFADAAAIALEDSADPVGPQAYRRKH
jgi:thiol-disulfide isomerase/thioredoxin